MPRQGGQRFQDQDERSSNACQESGRTYVRMLLSEANTDVQRSMMIPSIFLSSTLRFSLLRVIVLSALVLIWNVPTLIINPATSALCAGPGKAYAFNDSLHAANSAYRLKCLIYAYGLYSLTVAHSVASAIGPKLGLPGIVDFTLIVGEILFFMPQVTSGQCASWISRRITWKATPTGDCEGSVDCKITKLVAIFIWIISVSLMLLAIMRIAEAIKTKGRYFWIIGHTQPGKATAKFPNVFQVLTGRHIWKAHFEGEGKKMVLSRGVVAVIFVLLLLGFAFTTIIIDPLHESNEVPVRIGMSPPEFRPPYEHVTVVVMSDFFHLSNVTVSSSGYSLSMENCDLISYTRSIQSFYCKSSRQVFVASNYTFLPRGDWTDAEPVQVMIGYTSDTSDIISRTETPVMLMPGMNLVGFAYQHRVRRFRSPTLATLGLFQTSDEFTISEISHLQQNPRIPPTNTGVSLLVLTRSYSSDIKVIQDYREKSVLRGFSSVGGLWTFFAFIFGALFGSSLVRVAFGSKPLSVVGVAHSAVQEETRKAYQKTYPSLDSDIQNDRKKAGIMALLIDQLVDLGPLSNNPESSNTDEGNDVESIVLSDIVVGPGGST